MAQLTTTSIILNGMAVRQFTSFTLSQGIYEHHFFRLICPAEAIDGPVGAILSHSKNLIGASLSAQIGTMLSGNNLQFKGIVSQVQAERYSGSTGDVVITGYSATILLDNGPHCKSWEKKAVKNIVQDVLKHFPENVINPKISPIYPETLAYYVQYQETAWRFLCRLCSNFGEWFYFDGKSLQVGMPTQKNPVTLTFGNNLSRFNISLQARPPGMQTMAYDFLNNEVYSSSPSGIENLAGLNDWGKKAYQASQQMYASTPKNWNNNYLTNKKQLDDSVNMQAGMSSSNHVIFSGSSDEPGIAVGGKISVRGKNIFSLVSEEFGDYTVLSVNHYTDGQGNYNNDFRAVPISVKLPPVAQILQPICEAQSALVTDNFDPKGMGRIRVKFHWMNGSEKTPWIRVTSPHGGGGKGMHFIPEIGEEVIVGFESDSATKPYVIGTVYHGKASASYSNEGNDVKALQTRSGTKIIMNDKDGSVFIEDPSGNTWLMDGKGNINVNAPNNMTFNVGKNFDIKVGENMTTTIGANESVNIGKNKTLSVANDYQQSSDNKTVSIKTDSSEHIGNSYKQMAGESDIQTFKGDMKIRGTALTVIQGGKDVKVSKA